MMLCGVGTDLIEIQRVKKAARREAFLRRVFTEREISLCRGKGNLFASLAARFAGKEAVLKALGCGLSGCSWQDVEILSGAGGCPQVLLTGGAARIAAARGIDSVSLSLSHSREMALAFCVAEGSGDHVAGNS